jgi:hypothetical protein
MMILLNIVVQLQLTDPAVIIEDYIKPALVSCNLLMSLICDVLKYAAEYMGKRLKNPINITSTDIWEIMNGLKFGFSKRAEIRGIDYQ